jgi:hypothetical protein
MEKIRNIIIILTFALAFCFLQTSLAQAGPSDPVTENWANMNLENKNRAVSLPLWKITQDGSSKSVKWVDHALNTRFAIYDLGTPEDESDDVVLDKETKLVWTRNAGHGVINYYPHNRGPWQNRQRYSRDYCREKWHSAVDYCRDLTAGNRKGWRLPALEELLSLIDPSQSNPALPSGHPFVDVKPTFYLSITSDDFSRCFTQGLNMFDGSVYNHLKDDAGFNVWCVRGGSGYSGGNW